MTQTAKKVAPKKVAPKKAAFNINEKPKAQAKKKHYLPADARALICKIGKDLPGYMQLVTQSFIASAKHGILGGLDPNNEVTITPGNEWYFNCLFAAIGKYDFSGKEPYISPKDSEDIKEQLEEIFSAYSFKTRIEFIEKCEYFISLVITYEVIDRAKKGWEIDADNLIISLQEAKDITDLAEAIFEMNEPERKKKLTEKEENENKTRAYIDFAQYPTVSEEAKGALIHRIAQHTVKNGSDKVMYYPATPHINYIQCKDEKEANDIADLLKQHFTKFAEYIKERGKDEKEHRGCVYTYCYSNNILSHKN